MMAWADLEIDGWGATGPEALSTGAHPPALVAPQQNISTIVEIEGPIREVHTLRRSWRPNRTGVRSFVKSVGGPGLTGNVPSCQSNMHDGGRRGSGERRLNKVFVLCPNGLPVVKWVYNEKAHLCFGRLGALLSKSLGKIALALCYAAVAACKSILGQTARTVKNCQEKGCLMRYKGVQDDTEV